MRPDTLTRLLSNGSFSISLGAVVLALAGLVPASASFATELAAATVTARASTSGPSFEASVEAVRQATVAVPTVGRILELRGDAGKSVKAGELLARIDVREAAGADAANRAQLAQARAALERARELHARKFVSQAALDQAEAAFKSAQGAASASAASTSHGTAQAPMAGIIARRHVEIGDIAGPGVSLYTLFDPGSLRVVAHIPQSQLAVLRGAKTASVEFPELGVSLAATRLEILPVLDAASHTATLRLYLPAGTAGLLPGMAARVRLAASGTAPQPQKLFVPAAAILRRGEVTAVYVLSEQGPPRLRQIRPGEALAEGVEILAGLAAGERVALDPVKAGILARQAAPQTATR